MKGIVVFFGESFRLGRQGSRNIGSEESLKDQLLATESHLDFLRHLEDERGIEVRCVVNTYETKYTQKIKEKYGATFFNSNPIHMGRQEIFNQSCDITLKILQGQDFVLFMRIDLILKDGFKKSFVADANKVLWPSICSIGLPSICPIGLHKHGNSPRVNDTMVYVPKKRFDLIEDGKIAFCHEGWHHLNKFVEKGGQGFFLKTLHDSDSAKDWNPLYRIAGREENSVWHSKEFELDGERIIKKLSDGSVVDFDKYT